MIKFATNWGRLIFGFARYTKSKGNLGTETQSELLGNLNKAYDELNENLQSEQSVLNMFTDKPNQQSDSSQPTDNEHYKEYMRLINKSFSSYFIKLSPEEQLKRSKDFMKAAQFEKDWESKPKRLNEDYQDYSLFDKSMLQIKATGAVDQDETFTNKADLQFLGDLHKDITNRREDENVYSYIYENPKFTSFLMPDHYKEEENDDDIEGLANEESSDDPFDEQAADLEDWYEDDSVEGMESHNSRLSFNAKFELFDLFNKGWSVRDLSLRYGIMPDRVKAIVYQKKYFFDEVYPSISLNLLRDLVNLEFYYETIYGCVDYGVDLEDMTSHEYGYLQTNFKQANRNVDVNKLKPEEQERLKRMFEKKTSKKSDWVTERFHGEGNKGYYIKSWIMHKTRSRHSVPPMFERVIKDSNRPYKLPQTVQERLHKGPRLAGAKFGHK